LKIEMLHLSQRIKLSSLLHGYRFAGLRGDTIRERGQWPTCNRDFLRRRYDRIAPFISFFDWALFQPSDLRKRAVDRLRLRAGDRVLEVGCGTGRNFPLLQGAIGPDGRVYGIDLSAGMLHEAQRLCCRRQWRNVILIEGDAADYVAPELMDGVLFSFCYNTMHHHIAVLRRSWDRLRPGRRLVIVDGKVPPGLLGKLVLPFALWLMRRTLLGNPLIRPWEHLARLVENFQMEELRFGSYYICYGTKPGDQASPPPERCYDKGNNYLTLS
jgi:demethylmenaquinone methyltransferase/2-methoxy-6-polyprenyl-1,4-benzoquinol methylase